MHLKDIQEREASDSADYFPRLRQDPLYLGIALAGETGEVCNKIKKWARDEWTDKELAEEVKDELADILIYLVMLADELELDLEKEWEVKKEYNDRRYLEGV